jgi:GT2 family glycosyltransferase
VQWDPEKSRFIALHEGAKDDGLGSGIPHETGYACGCAFFVPAARLRDIGLLCDDFFLYFEETDWCYRARAAGHPSMLVPDAKVWHKVSVSFGGENSPLALYFITRNRMLWAKRHATVSQRLRLHTESLRTLFRRFILPLLGGRVRGPLTPKVWWWSVREAFLEGSNIAYYFGVRDFWLRRFGDCPPAVRQLARQPPQFSGSVSTISQPE